MEKKRRGRELEKSVVYRGAGFDSLIKLVFLLPT
jgi:hypothetical protein